MGRKKRPAAAAAFEGASQPPAYLPPPAAVIFDQYGRPVPPLVPPAMMPPAMMPPPPPHPVNLPDGSVAGKRQRVDGGADVSENGERTTYPVKKYRPDSYYKTIEAFQKYTKSHRMDAAYVKWTGGGATPEKPEVYGIRIAGSFLSWGRGKTRDSAIDAAIRAAFALVAAHGYNDFALTDDCFTEEPAISLAPMPPPPPPPMLPPGAAPLPPGLPPGLPPPSFAIPPSGVPPNFAIPPPPADGVLIPQPSAPKVEVAVASAVGGAGIPMASAIGSSVAKPTAINIKPALSTSSHPNGATSTSNLKKESKNKLVFMGEDVDEAGEELSMEELRSILPRYWNETVKALAKRKKELVSLETAKPTT
ncbi:hypothetical protein ACHAXM_006767 [Skeletonema potamos]|jgi:hypothetical protein